MQKITLIGLGIMLILLVGCDTDSKGIVSTIECTNKAVWDYRSSYDDFDCKLTYLTGQKALRECTATIVGVKGDDINNYEIIEIKLNTTCLTTCYDNCYCDGNCFPKGARIY